MSETFMHGSFRLRRNGLLKNSGGGCPKRGILIKRHTAYSVFQGWKLLIRYRMEGETVFWDTFIIVGLVSGIKISGVSGIHANSNHQRHTCKQNLDSIPLQAYILDRHSFCITSLYLKYRLAKANLQETGGA